MKKIILSALLLFCVVACRASVLVYVYSGTETAVGGNETETFAYQGEFIFDSSQTNATWVGWDEIRGHKSYWTNGFSVSNSVVLAIPGPGTQVYTVLAKIGQNTDSAGNPHVWSFLYKGKNATLALAKGQTYQFPSAFSGNETEIKYEPALGQLIMLESVSTYAFSAAKSQAANKNGQAVADVVAALVDSLQAKGY